jgi:hypothetical protein
MHGGVLLYLFLHVKAGIQQVSYDWSKGAENHNPSGARNYILLHPTQVIYGHLYQIRVRFCVTQ